MNGRKEKYESKERKIDGMKEMGILITSKWKEYNTTSLLHVPCTHV